MLRLFKWIVIAPFAILFLIFAFANRNEVSVSFNPFESDIPGLALHAPMFLVIILSIALGVVAGGVTTWFSQGRHRRALRSFRAEAERLRADLRAAKESAPPTPGLARRA